MSPDQIPADMVERAARAIAGQSWPDKHGQLCPVWTRKAAVETCDCWILPNAEADAGVALAAALDGCEVREEWIWTATLSHYIAHGTADSREAMDRGLRFYRTHGWDISASSRLVITTTAEPMEVADAPR